MKKYWPLILVLIGGTFLRFYHNLDISLWHDEAFSALLIKYNWSEMIYRIGLDVHPPMYYIFLRIWNYAFGDSLLSLRGFSILFSTGTIWAAWLLVKEAFKNEKAALWAAILVAVNPFALRFATEARMYTFGAFFVLLAAYFLVKALNEQKILHESESSNMPNLPENIKLTKMMFLNYAGFTISTIVIIYTHYYLFFSAAALMFYGLVFLYFHHRWNIKKYANLLASYLIVGVSFLPWLKTFLFQYKQVGAGYWIPQMDWYSIPSTLWDMLLGMGRDLNKPSTKIWVIIVALISLFIFIRFLRKTQSFHKWLMLFAVIAPFGGAHLFYAMSRLKGSQTSVYLDRYFLFASVFFSLVLAIWLKKIKYKWLSVSLFWIYVLANLFTFNNYWTDLNVKTKPGMAEAVRVLKENIQPKDKVYVGSSFMFFNLKYYLGQEKISNKPLLYSGGNKEVNSMPHYAGTAILTNEDLLPNYNQDAHKSDTIWLIWTNGFGASEPLVPDNWKKIKEDAYAEIRPYVSTYVYITEFKIN